MKKVIISLLLVLGALNILNAQNELETCTASHEKAFGRVVFYLTDSQLINERIEAGAVNISVDQISHVDDPDDCNKITTILNANPKFKRVLEGAKSTRFYYQTNDFYYATWTNVNRILGTSSIFIIIKKSNEQTHYCYF